MTDAGPTVTGTGGGLRKPPPDLGPPPGEPSTARAPRWLVALAVLGVLGTALFAVLWIRSDDAGPDTTEMAGTAREFVTALTNFDGADIDEDFDAIAGFAAGEFADQIETTFGDQQTRTDLREAQAASRGEIVDLFVQSFDGDQGRVFAVVDQTVANNRTPAPQADTLRAEIVLREIDGEWKVIALNVLQAPAAGPVTEPGADGEATTTTAPPG
ncbi:hypothetical protein BH20ACT2_BH20ACT2_06240 [soil metagenome]